MTQSTSPNSLYVSSTAANAAASNHIGSQPQTMPASTALTQVSTVLGGILLLILCIGWLVKRAGFAPQARNTKLLNVAASCQVGRNEKVVVVEVNNTWLVLGVTATQITQLHTLDAPLAEKTPATSPSGTEKPADFRQLLKKVLKRPGNQE